MKTNIHKILLTLMSMLPLAASQASELSVEQTKPYKLSEAEAKELLLPQRNENQSANTFSLNGFTLEFDTRRLKYNQIEIKALADPKLNFYGYLKQDMGGNFGSRARIVIDSVLNSNGEEILNGDSTNKKHLQGIGFSEQKGEHRAFRRVFLQEESHHGDAIEAKGTIYFSLPTEWNIYAIDSFEGLSAASADPNFDAVDTSLKNSVIFRKSSSAKSIQVVLMSYDANGERIKAGSMSPSSTAISYSWNKDAPKFKNGYVCVAGERTEIEVPFSVKLSNKSE